GVLLADSPLPPDTARRGEPHGDRAPVDRAGRRPRAGARRPRALRCLALRRADDRVHGRRGPRGRAQAQHRVRLLRHRLSLARRRREARGEPPAHGGRARRVVAAAVSPRAADMTYETLTETEWERVQSIWDLLEDGELERARLELDDMMRKRERHPDLKIVD